MLWLHINIEVGLPKRRRAGSCSAYKAPLLVGGWFYVPKKSMFRFKWTLTLCFSFNLLPLLVILHRLIKGICFSWAEKAMAPHSSTLAWKIPWTEAPGRLQSMGSGRVGHDWATSLSLFTFMHWRRKWQPTPVFLPGEPQGPGSLVGFRLWGRTESDTTEVT